MIDDASEATVEDDERYDVIVIGSGMGGLTCASLLAQLRGLRVLVLERHWRLGGFTHWFRRPNVGRFDVGLHYVGQMSEADPLRALMDLVTAGAVSWRPLPSPFERYHFPGLSIGQPAGRDAWMNVLMDRWPTETDAIVRHFAAVDTAFEWFGSRLLPGRSSGPSTRRESSGTEPAFIRATTREALDSIGLRSPELRAVLTATWGNYGLPPAKSAFLAHALIVRHFLDGGWFPEGGAGGIATSTRAVVENAGGRCLAAREVETVLIEQGRAVGVRVVHGPPGRRQRRDYRAPIVISDAGARTTFTRLLGEDAPGRASAVQELRSLPTGSSAVQLFIGLRRSASVLGMHGENQWLFASYDHDRHYERRNEILQGTVENAYLSFPSRKDPSAPYHTAEILAPLDHAAVAAWRGLPWKRRGPAYDGIKERISDALLDFAEGYLPGLRSLVHYTELGTPLTMEAFTGHAEGAIYGLPPVPLRYALSCLRVETPVRGLLLTGSDIASAGIVGAMIGGVATVGHVLGLGGIARVMAAARGGQIRETVAVG
ncbi:MAG: NAD(P)/FAD-dependent oxidoreductase [Gemmatimonadaceae bacterium]